VPRIEDHLCLPFSVPSGDVQVSLVLQHSTGTQTLISGTTWSDLVDGFLLNARQGGVASLLLTPSMRRALRQAQRKQTISQPAMETAAVVAKYTFSGAR